jgi:hypothetical protein
VKTESATPPNQRDEAQNRDGVRENHPFFKTLLSLSPFGYRNWMPLTKQNTPDTGRNVSSRR